MGHRLLLVISLFLALNGKSYSVEDILKPGFNHPSDEVQTTDSSERVGTLMEVDNVTTYGSEEENRLSKISVLEGSIVDGNATLVENNGNNSQRQSNITSYRVNCTLHNYETAQVELVDSTRLINLLMANPNVTSLKKEAECVVVLFYAPWCPFSSFAAPHFNALPRAFPKLKIAAVDAMKYPSFNTQYGVVGVPTVILFHNGRIAAKYNESEYVLGRFEKFIAENTDPKLKRIRDELAASPYVSLCILPKEIKKGIAPVEKMFVTSADFVGPVSSTVVREIDYCLWLSWMFIAFSAVFLFTKSSWCHWIVEAVQNTWRESEAQHEHIE